MIAATFSHYQPCWAVKGIAADEAPAGLDLLRRDGEIGIVLMDMMMPEIDGYDAMSTVQNDNRIGDVPVIGLDI